LEVLAELFYMPEKNVVDVTLWNDQDVTKASKFLRGMKKIQLTYPLLFQLLLIPIVRNSLARI